MEINFIHFLQSKCENQWQDIDTNTTAMKTTMKTKTVDRLILNKLISF
jgi:hypothetical protein